MARILLLGVAAVIAAIVAFWLVSAVLHWIFLALMIVLVVALVMGVFRVGRWSSRSRG